MSTIITETILIICICVLLDSCKKKEVPVLSTREITNISTTSATSGGKIIDDGNGAIVEQGSCWNTTGSPTIIDTKTSDGGSSGIFTSHLGRLTQNTAYFVRAYATNEEGTGYGNTVKFTTNKIVSVTLTTADISTIEQASAVSGGNISADGGGTVSERGVCWNNSANPTVSNSKTNDGTGIGNFMSYLTNLKPGTTYYIRAYATNESGTVYGNELSFKTLPAKPTVTTAIASLIDVSSASSGGNITSDGGSEVTARGICWGGSTNPTINDQKTNNGVGLGTFISMLTGLEKYSKYYIRAYATNSVGTAYGNEVTIVTLQPDQIADIDGNIYNTVTIGTQVWMKENLRVTKYSDGTSIPYITSDSEWTTLTINNKAYCFYNNDAPNGMIYGALYTWAAAMNGSPSSSSNPSGVQGVCPTGWHLPSDAEWEILRTYLGGYEIAGEKMKVIGTTYWRPSNGGATNESGFSAIGSGIRGLDGLSSALFEVCIWWSSTIYVEPLMNRAGRWNVASYPNFINVQAEMNHGFSVRCIKD